MPDSLRELPTALPMRGLVSVPPRSQRQQRLPMLVFLHGNDEAAPVPLRTALTRHGPLRPGNAAIAIDEFVVVAPQLPQRDDAWHRFGVELALVLDDVESEYNVDPERVYLTGFSFGANGVFDLAAMRAYPWAALWAVDPTRVPAVDPRLPVWLSSGQVSRQHARQFAARLRLQAPIVGASERVYHDAGLDHVGTATLAYFEPTVYRWLLKHRLRHGIAAATTAHTDVR